MKKLLVAYASKSGSTVDVAKAVGDVLKDNGFEVDILPAKKVKNLDGYDGIVLGTAVRMGKPVGEATRFIKKHGRKIGSKPMALFSVGLAMKEDTPKSRQDAEGFLSPITDVVKPVSLALFGGKLDYSTISPMFRFAFSRMSGDISEGDWRNWDDIRSWAESLPVHFA